MKNIAIKLSVVCAVALVSACSGPDALFPSLIGGDSVENADRAYKTGADTGTFVGQKIVAFRQELKQIKNSDQANRKELEEIRKEISANTTQYNNVVGTMESKLQIGTTPGNPDLYNMLRQAQENVQQMSLNANALDSLSVKFVRNATSTTYLIDSIRAAFNVSGAVDEDHRQLRNLQNEAEQLLIAVNSVNDEMNAESSRQQQLLSSSQNQLNRLNSAIRNGNFIGSSTTLSTTPVAAAPTRPVLFGNKAKTSATVVRNPKPLFVAKFKNDNTNYKDGLSTAVKAAVNRKSNAVFNVVAVSETALQSKAQGYAEKIVEEISAMGVDPQNINLSTKNDVKTDNAEVWIFVK